MIWSDNDVANDFTTMKNSEGEQVKIRKTYEIEISLFFLNRHFFSTGNLLNSRDILILIRVMQPFIS